MALSRLPPARGLDLFSYEKLEKSGNLTKKAYLLREDMTMPSLLSLDYDIEENPLTFYYIRLQLIRALLTVTPPETKTQWNVRS